MNQPQFDELYLTNPPSLDEGIRRCICLPVKILHERLYKMFRDWAAQKFQAAMIEHGEDEKVTKILDDLFNRIFIPN